MRKLCLLAMWLVAGLSGVILVVFVPNSWQCAPTPVNNVAWNPTTGKILVEYEAGQHVELWDPAGEQPERTYLFAAHTGAVRAVAYSPDARIALTGSADSTAILWDVQSGTVLHTLEGHGGEVWSVAYAPDAKTALTGSNNGDAFIWDTGDGALLHTLQVRGHTAQVLSVAYSPDSRTVLTGSADGTTYLWDVQSGRLIYTLAGHYGAVESIAFAPDGLTALTGGTDGDGTLICPDLG